MFSLLTQTQHGNFWSLAMLKIDYIQFHLSLGVEIEVNIFYIIEPVLYLPFFSDNSLKLED